MKNKILIIFLISCIFLYIIYRFFYIENNSVLLIGDRSILDFINYDKEIETFLYNKTSYGLLYKSINNNDKKVVKNENIYLNQLIHNSKYIIVYVDSYCNNSEITNKNIKKLSKKIRSISNANIYFVRNDCNKDLLSNEDFIFIDKNDINSVYKMLDFP